MKKMALYFALGAALIATEATQAVQFRNIPTSHFSSIAKEKNSMAFYGLVEKIENKNGIQQVTFHIKEPLRGLLKVDQTLVLNFPARYEANGFRVDPLVPPPSFSQNEEVVLFVGANQAGKHIPIGGEQGVFRVKDLNGTKMLLNGRQNLNLVSPGQNATVLDQEIARRVQNDAQHFIAYDDLKKLMNQ